MDGGGANRIGLGRIRSGLITYGFLMQTYLICCAELPERRDAALAHLDERGVSARVVNSVHGDTWKLATTAEYDRGKRISPGHVGLLLGHWFAWNLIEHDRLYGVRHPEDYPGPSAARDAYLVLEDDAVLPDDWDGAISGVLNDLAEHYPEWELCFVGLCESEPRVWNKITERIGPPDSRLCRICMPYGTHAYLVRGSAVHKLIRYFPDGGACRNADQQLFLNVLQPNRVNWCAVLPTLVRQRTFDYTGSGSPEWGPSCTDPAEKTERPLMPPLSEQDAQRAAGRNVPPARVSAESLAATLRAVDPFPCIYRGEAREDHGRVIVPVNKAGFTRGLRTVPVFDCARLGVPCHSKRAELFPAVRTEHGDARACETCELRTSMGRGVKRDRLDLPEGHFNPSMIRWRGRLLLATRDSWGHSRVALWWLDNQRPDWSGAWTATPIGSYAANHPEAPRLEDPRLFVAPDPDSFEMKVHAAFNLPDAYPPKRVQVGYVRFAADLSGIEHTEVFRSPAGNAYEKNWSPIYYASPDSRDPGEIRWVYAMKPQHVVMGKQGWTTDNPLPWAGGVMRGGAAPVRVGNFYYSFFHGCLKRFSGSVYTIGCYVFEANPPHRIVRQTPVPLVWPELPGPDESVVKSYVLWPGGAVLHAGSWWLACGVDDCHCRIVRLGFEEVEAAMTDVPETTGAMSLRDTPLARGTPISEMPQ